MKVSVTDTDLFTDIIQLLAEAAEKDNTILKQLNEIMAKHDLDIELKKGDKQ